MNSNEGTEQERLAWEALRLALIADDKKHEFWSEAEVQGARSKFMRLRGSIPSLTELEAHYGERLFSMIDTILQERVNWLLLNAALQGTHDPCHVCKATDSLTYHPFGLSRVLSKQRNWKGTAVSAAVSAISLPLVGAGALYGPSTEKTAQIMRMRLVLCQSCLNERKGLLGGFLAKSKHAKCHPLWDSLNEAGYELFIDAHDLENKWS